MQSGSKETEQVAMTETTHRGRPRLRRILLTLLAVLIAATFLYISPLFPGTWRFDAPAACTLSDWTPCHPYH
jgi:hypothetical protein